MSGEDPFRLSDELVETVAALRPNASIDHYPYQAAKGEGRAELERQYAPAKNVGNPMTVRPNGAVQALVAEGFGTLSPAVGQEVRGAGAWHDRTWSVVLARPLGDPQTTPLAAGGRTYVAFAIWDGSAGDVGARKMRSVWVPLELMPLAPAQRAQAAVAQ